MNVSKYETICEPVVNSDNYQIILFTICYALPSYIMHFFVIILIRNHRHSSTHFNSAFFRLFTFNSHLCLIAFSIDFVFFRLPGLGFYCVQLMELFAEGSYLLSPLYFVAYHVLYAVSISTTMIMVNRLTAVLFPFKFQELWTTWLPISYGITLITPIVFTWHLIISPGTLDIAGNIMGLAYVKTITWMSNSSCSAIMASFTGIVQILLTVATIAVLMTMRAHIRQSIEMQLLFVGMSLSAASLATATTQILMYVFLYTSKRDLDVFVELYRIRPFTYDILTLGPPWMLFILSRQFRKIFTDIWRSRRSTVGDILLAGVKVVTSREPDSSRN